MAPWHRRILGHLLLSTGRNTQEDAGEPLQCPVRSTESVVGNGYKSLVSHFIQFQEHGHNAHGKSYIMKDVALKLQC